MEYLGKTDFVHKKPVDGEQDSAALAAKAAQAEKKQKEVKVQAKAFVPEENTTAITESENIQAGSGSVLSAHMAQMMGDAPMCNLCGHLTVRNGACYKCLNCGNSIGCS